MSTEQLHVVLLGPQGSGKGTQAGLLRERMGLVHIASGDVMREERQDQSELGAALRKYMDAGELVPDEITVALLLDRIKRSADTAGVVLDGFPRTVAQARALDEALAAEDERIDAVVELDVPLDVARSRLEGRVVCRICGTVYNVKTNPPKAPGVCDRDGGELYTRADDYPEAIARRLEIWARENKPLEEYYERRGLLIRVDADRPPRDIADDITDALRERSEAVAGR